MTKQDLFKRFETAYKMGLLQPEVLQLAERWCDGIMRLEGGQFHNFMDIMISERERTRHFATDITLGNDRLGYKIIQLFAILTHPCQKCAEDPKAWHTRSAFCNHKDK